MTGPERNGYGTRLSPRRVVRALVIALTLPALQGCLALGAVALKAVPAVIGGVAVAGSGDVDPFAHPIRYGEAPTDAQLAALDEHLRRAGCGDAESQYWIGTALANGLNKTPDEIEIYKWFRLAQIGGYAPAGERLAVLETEMPEADVAEARARASAWRPATEGCPVGG